MQITVLMTMYNGGEYLNTSVKSVLNQTYKNFEFLIIDDCSTDGSCAVIESFKDNRIKLYKNEKNIGQTASLNIGLKYALGKYVARIDADDLAYPSWLEKQFEFVQENLKYAVVSTKAVVINETNQIKKILNSPISSQEILLKSIMFSPINHVGSLMQKNIILDVGGYDESYKIAADYELWSKLICKGHQLTSITNIGVAIRMHEESISILEREKSGISEMLKIISKNIENLTNLEVNENQVKKLWQLIYEVGTLEDKDFLSQCELLRNIYKKIKPSFKINEFSIFAMINSQDKTIYIKRIFYSISKRNIQDVRLISLDYIQRKGGFNFFGIIWILSFSGNLLLGRLPFIYLKYSILRAKMKSLVGLSTFCL